MVGASRILVVPNVLPVCFLDLILITKLSRTLSATKRP